MNIYVYSDESGVLDKFHNDYYVFGGLLFLSEEEKETQSRKFTAAENNIRLSEGISPKEEVKACNITAESKRKLYRNVAKCERFGVVIDQKKLRNDNLFMNKKTKQRYLDWAYKMGIKKKFERMILEGTLKPEEVETIVFLVDEHSTATDGCYELRESLEKELKIGMWNFDYMIFHKPLFPNVKSVNVQYCNSSKKALVRAADIIANHLFYLAHKNNGFIPSENKLNVYYHP